MTIKKIGLEDIGRLVRPKVLVEAFLHTAESSDNPYNWWTQVNQLARSSKTYKKDTIVGTYGLPLSAVFADLDNTAYVGVIQSFIIFHGGEYRFINTSAEAQKILHQAESKRHQHWSLRAVGIKFHQYYDPKTQIVGPSWQPKANLDVIWYYRPKCVIPFETIELFNSIKPGDIVLFKTTLALVTEVKTLHRQTFYNAGSWAAKRITILTGKHAHQIRLVTNRPWEIIKAAEKDQRMPSES